MRRLGPGIWPVHIKFAHNIVEISIEVISLSIELVGNRDGHTCHDHHLPRSVAAIHSPPIISSSEFSSSKNLRRRKSSCIYTREAAFELNGYLVIFQNVWALFFCFFFNENLSLLDWSFWCFLIVGQGWEDDQFMGLKEDCVLRENVWAPCSRVNCVHRLD